MDSPTIPRKPAPEAPGSGRIDSPAGRPVEPVRPVTPSASVPVKATKADAINPKPNTLYESNGYYYRTDEYGRLKEASGDLRLGKADRNHSQQRAVGKSSGVPGDEGGHMIGTRFDGPGDGPLHMVPQHMKLNRGKGSRWTKMEREWAAALERGDKVSVKIEIDWPTGSKRPDGFNVEYSIIDGKTGISTSKKDYFINPK